jgi:hypothetical protein
VLPVAVALTVLLGLYVGAYYWLAEPFPPSAFPGERYTANVAGYPLKWMGTFFAPIHWLDRRIPPHVWEPMPLWECTIPARSLQPFFKPAE